MSKTEVIRSYRAEPIRLGSFVRWSEFPDRLYIVRNLFQFCGEECAKLETIDHKFSAMVPVFNLTLDDVDFDVVEVKLNLLEKSLRWIRNRMPKSKAASIDV